MFDALETGWGLDVVLWLQSFRNSALEILVTILDYMGEELVYIALIALIYWTFSKKLGTRLVFVLVIASFVTAFAKDAFATERPYEVSALVNETVQEESYGLPSGHALISMAVWVYFAYALKRRWLWALVGVYMLLQGFGRMLAGAHYPQDILGGWILGAATLFLFISFADKVAAFWKNASSALRLGLISISMIVLVGIVALMSSRAPLSLTLPAPCPEEVELVGETCIKNHDFDAYFTSIGLFLGATLGVWLENSRVQFKSHAQLWRRLAHYVLGLLFAMILLMGLGVLADAISETGWLAHALRVIRYATVTIFALALWPWISQKFGLMEEEGERAEAKATY